MNRLAFSTVISAGDAGERRLALIAEAGFDGVEPTFTLQDGWPCATDPRPTAERLRAAADRLGLAIPSMRGGPGFWPTFASSDPAQRDRAVTLADHALEALAILGGDTLLIVPGQWNAAQRYDEVWQSALDTARRVGPLAEARGMMVALENVENRFLLSPNEWALFLEQVGSPHVRMYFDVGNVVRNCQGHPQQWLRQLGPSWIHRIHFKDAHTGGAVVNLYDGEVEWEPVREAIRAIGYTNWVGVELDIPTTGAEAMLRASRDDARKILGAGDPATADKKVRSC